MTALELKQQALLLDPVERAHLARALLASLDELSEQECAALWLDEAERRQQELATGVAEELPVITVFAQASNPPA